jgi:hypothetical protein
MAGSLGPLCESIFAAIKASASTVEGLFVLREDGRRLVRSLKVDSWGTMQK